MTSPYFTDAEVDEICAGLTQNAAKCRFLAEVLKVPVKRKPNGRPLVLRADAERAGRASEADDQAGRATISASNEPNWQKKATR